MELRTDPITGRQVAFAPERASRPTEHAAPTEAKSLDRCPFCPGNEDLTPEAVLQLDQRGESSGEWLVRVIPNRYPAFSSAAVQADATSLIVESSASVEARGVSFDSAPGIGEHEVLIESPEHLCSMAELSGEQFLLVVEVYRERLLALREDDRLAFALIFKNQGAAAGASLEHVHSQLVATPFVPRSIDEELDAAWKFVREAQSAEASLWSAILHHEVSETSRVVYESDSFLVFCPYASRFPYETWIVPKRHEPDFTASPRREIRDFSELLHRTLATLEKTLPVPAYNFALCTAPFRDERSPNYHWHLKVTPRIAGIAGFEVGTGGWINVVMPEEAAAKLRAAW